MASNPLPDDVLKALQEEYKKTIPEKLSHLKNLIDELQRNPNLEGLVSLRQAVHKLAGSAGTYGYDQVSALCKGWEQLLLKKIEFFSKSPLETSFFEECNKNYITVHGVLSDGKK